MGGDMAISPWTHCSDAGRLTLPGGATCLVHVNATIKDPTHLHPHESVTLRLPFEVGDRSETIEVVLNRFGSSSKVDGGYHAPRSMADAKRDRALIRAGYPVVRIEAKLVMRDLPPALEHTGLRCTDRAEALACGT
jgi:hypothetical protein